MLIFISFMNTSPKAAVQMFIKIGALKNFAIMMLTYRFSSQNGGIMILCHSHRSDLFLKDRSMPQHISVCENKL